MMIEGSKQQQLTFDKGITNVPSDAICSDNALAESVGMVYDDGEHRVIQKPVGFITSAIDIGGTAMSIPTVLYVHKFNNEERFVGFIPTTTQGTTYNIFVWGVKNGAQFEQKGTLTVPGGALVYTGVEALTTIGKTLIVSNSSGMQYFLWTYDSSNDPTYEYLGDAFPRPEVDFKLTGRNDRDGDGKKINVARDSVKCNGIIYDDHGHPDITLGKQTDWNNAAVYLYSKLKKDIAKKKKFYGSFCVRVALELYDGTYFHIGNPIFMANHFSTYVMGSISGYASNEPALGMEVYGQELKYMFKQGQDFTKWSDIIKNVVVFVTDQAELCDPTIDAKVKLGDDTIHRSYFISGNGVYWDARTTGNTSGTGGPDQLPNDWWIIWEPLPDTDLSDIIKSGVYYKLCEIGTSGDGQWHNSSDHFNSHTIELITAQEQLEEDDFYSHCPIKSGLLYSYNSRLNIANVSRGFFDGFDNFMPFVTPLGGSANESATYTFHTTIKTDGGNETVSHTKTTDQIQGIYFYYPDARAKHVKIWKGSDLILDEDLTEHPTLNGSFYFAGITPTMVEPSGSASSIPIVTAGTELLPNYIIQSEINNPFVFKAKGYFKVGTGKILGMSSITQALSEGQFGQFPLLVFSESGVWALTVASTGYYDSIHPISREVSVDPACIIQTDGAVFFTSKKGLMVVVGSQVKCVSEQMTGETDAWAATNTSINTGNFLSFIKNCFMAYDYRDSLLWIFDKRLSTTYCYVYAIKNGSFSRYNMGVTVKSALNDYPDYLLQDSNNTIYSLVERGDINSSGEQSNRYTALMLTRPMKLENAFALKSIMYIRHAKKFKSGAMTMRIFASNNLDNWVELHSLRGTPWKYYRFRFDFSNMKATDRFAGTMLITQERRTNKLR